MINVCKAIAVVSFVLGVHHAFAYDHCAIKQRPAVTVNVMDTGAVGDGATNDTKAFQLALDRVAFSGGIVVAGKGIYLIDALVGIKIKSNTTLYLAKESQLQAISTNSGRYSIIRISDATNVAVIGGNLLGDRVEHQGRAGEWGMGISITRARNVLVKDVVSKNNWGDGFYVNGASKDIYFCSVTADGNRRQGLSIISGENISVIDSVFKNTYGTAPEAGIDIEPNRGDLVRGVHVMSSKFINNSGPGVASYVPAGSNRQFVTDIVFEDNMVVGNGAGGAIVFNASNVKIVRNFFLANRKTDIHLSAEVTDGVVVGNIIYRDQGDGRAILDEGVNSVVGNHLR